MTKLETAAGNAKRTRTATRNTRLALVPPTSAPLVERRAPRCLVLEGVGHPDCPEFQLAVEAMEAIAHVLRSAMERARRGDETLGEVEKSWALVRDQQSWEWRVRVLVPNSVTATALELARHLAGRDDYTERICLTAVRGYTIH